jgi:hypothetical protein
MGGAYIADLGRRGDYATVDSRTDGEKRPCVRHPGCFYTYFADTTLASRPPLSLQEAPRQIPSW